MTSSFNSVPLSTPIVNNGTNEFRNLEVDNLSNSGLKIFQERQKQEVEKDNIRSGKRGTRGKISLLSGGERGVFDSGQRFVTG